MPTLARRPSVTVAVVVLLLVAVAAAAALVRAGDGRADDGVAAKRFDDGCATTAVRFGVVQPEGDADGRSAAEAVTRELSRLTGCPAIVVARPTQDGMLAALALHQVDVAQIDPAALVVGERIVGLSIIGAYATQPDTPARTWPSRLWVRDGGPVRELFDLRTQTLALGPRLSVAGDLAPRAALLRAGVRVAGAAGAVPGAPRTTRAADDDAALRALRTGRAAAAVTRGGLDGASTRGLRAIWTSEPALADVVAIRPGIPNQVRRLVLAAFRDLPGAALAPLAARQGLAQPVPLLTVPADLYGPAAEQFDALTSAGLAP